jgi:uncharacterized protein YndB with AHSA1/START domain
MERSEKLIVTTPGDREIVLTRIFDAPRHLVFSAMTQPELIKRWLIGPPGWSMVACEVDLKVGGEFRYTWRNSNGTEMTMCGLYREILPDERIVSTERFEVGCEAQSGEQLATAVLSEEQGRTLFRCTLIYPSKQARDATIASGMEHGVAASYDRLAELLSSARVADRA